MAKTIEEAELLVDGVRVFYRRVPGQGTPTVYYHGNPTHGEEWVPFMERAGGPAIAIDMPGWGRSDRPDPERFDYSMYGLSAFLERCLGELGVRERKVMVNDWGVLALIELYRRPELIERLVIANAVPFTPGYRWHWVAQIWRRRPLGELANATSTRFGMALGMRQARGDRKAMPPEFIDLIWRFWDRGTKRAVLALYRDADPDRLVAAGEGLARLSCPTLVLWGDRDPYLPAKFGEAYARALPDARFEPLLGLGHWPWVEDPSVVDRALAFLEK